MTTTDLLALADRVEKLPGPCRETDAAICKAINPDAVNHSWSKLPGDVAVLCGDQHWRDRKAPAYTSSLDAAMTLVPEGYDWIVASVNGQIGGTPYACVGDEKAHFAETPVLSLVLACLRARASTYKGEA